MRARLFQSTSGPLLESAIPQLILRDEKSMTMKRQRFDSILTENKRVQALVLHVLIDQDLLVSVDATTEQPDEIPVLKLRDQLNLVHELL